MLLELLRQNHGRVNKTRLVKLLFLMKEKGLVQDTRFYSFVPYKYGPFSFELYQDLRKLEEKRIIRTEKKNETELVILNCPIESQKITKLKVSNILDCYGNLRTDEILEYVYSNYPFYTTNSLSISPRKYRMVAPIAIYTVGYEKRSIDDFFNLMIRSGICQLIDIRNNPLSRVYGFSGNTLRRISENLGISYLHFPEYGISSSKRACALKECSFELLFEEYSENLNKEKHQRIIAEIEGMPSVLLCQESIPGECHRSRLASHLKYLTGLEIVDL